MEVVRRDLVRDPNSAAFLREVDQGAVRRGSDSLQCGIELGAAVTPLGSEHVASDAFRVETDEHVLSAGDSTLYQRDVLFSREGTLERVDAEGPVTRGEASRHGEEDVITERFALPGHDAVPMDWLYIRIRPHQRSDSR